MSEVGGQPLQRVKVCCFCERWESGGIESFLTNVLQRIDLKQFQVDIVASSIGKSVFTERLQKCGVRFWELSGNQRKLVQNYRLFCCLLRRERYDIVHLNIFHGLSLYYAVLAKRLGVPVRIAHSHNTGLQKSRTLPAKLLIHKAAKTLYTNAATDLWACSGAAAEFLFSKKLLAEKSCRFIPNGIDTARFRFESKVREAVRKNLGLKEKLVIGNVGRLCYQKNQTFLLDILLEVQKQKKESCLLLVGEGEERNALEAKAKHLGIADSVIFCGVSTKPEHLLWAMDVFVFPSWFEGLGIVAVEAQAAGLRTIVSEAVPEEAFVTPNIKRASVGRKAEYWAKMILDADDCMRPREIYASVVRSAGFEIADVAQKIEAYFQKEV